MRTEKNPIKSTFTKTTPDTLNEQFRRHTEEFCEFPGVSLADFPFAVDGVGDPAAGTEDRQEIRLAKIASFQ